MTARPVLPLWVGDFVRDTLDLSATEGGAYLFLLLAAWADDDGSLPDDDAALRRIARVDARNWPRMRPRILRFFKLGDDDRWRQKRLSAEIQKSRDISGERKVAARKRWGKAPAGPVDNPVNSCGQPMHRETRPRSHTLKGQKASEINGAPMQEHMQTACYLNLKESESTYCLPLGGADGNAAQKKQELKKGFLQEAPAAPYRATRPPRPASSAGAKRDTPPAGNPRTRWEAELAANLGPDDFAQAIPLLEADKALCARATAAERRQPGSGAHVAAAGLLKLTRARP